MDLVRGKWHLNDMAVLQFEGEDAANFLHAQITNSVKKLPVGQAMPCGYCNAKGRLLANGILIAVTADRFYFLIAKDLAQAITKRLQMFVLRSKVTVKELENIKIYGFCGTENIPENITKLNPWQTLADKNSATDKEIIWVKAPDVNNQSAWLLSGSSLPEYTETEISSWYANRIINGWPLIRHNAYEKFLTTALNMDLNGSIDFNKGCYPGQEIIARSHFRGTVKRRMAQGRVIFTNSETNNEISIDKNKQTQVTGLSNETQTAGTQILDLYSCDSPTERPVARVIETAQHDGYIYVCAEVNIQDIDNCKYLLGPNGPAITMKLANPQ